MRMVEKWPPLSEELRACGRLSSPAGTMESQVSGDFESSHLRTTTVACNSYEADGPLDILPHLVAFLLPQLRLFCYMESSCVTFAPCPVSEEEALEVGQVGGEALAMARPVTTSGQLTRRAIEEMEDNGCEHKVRTVSKYWHMSNNLPNRIQAP